MNIDKENLQILSAGSTSVFWQTLKESLWALKLEAINELVMVAPERVGDISELQQMVRVVDKIVGLVEGARSELETIEEGGKS